jgi:hypothetical protein
MAGTALSGFNDFNEATGPLYLTGDRYIVNEAQLQTYSFGNLTLGDRGKKKMVQGGSTIRESVVFDTNNATRFHKPGDTQNWANPQPLKKIEARWRFAITHKAWTRQEVILNERIKFGDADAVYQAYVDLAYEKEMLMWTDKWNFMEEALWAAPNISNMESDDGTDAYSIPVFVNEDTNGLFNPRASSAWTTIEGINPTSTGYTLFKPVQRTYTSEAINNMGNIISQFDGMWKDLRYEMPPTYQEYFTNPKYNKLCIYCSSYGHTAVGMLIREHTTEGFVHIAGAQDPSCPNPQFHGVPIVWVSTLDDAALYNSGSSTVVKEGDATIVGPRFYWINSEFLYPVFHDEMYFEVDKVSKHHNDPDTYVQPVSTWYNVVCTSRQRQGIVSPATADQYSLLY